MAKVGNNKFNNESFKGIDEEVKNILSNTFIRDVPIAVFVKDKEGRYMYINNYIENKFGKKKEEWIGKTDFDLWPLEDAKRFRKDDSFVFEKNKPLSITEKVPVKNKITSWFTLKFPIKHEGNYYLGGISVEIQSLIEKNEGEGEYLKKIIDSMGDPVFVKDEKHRWILVNDAFCKFVGRFRDQLLGKSDYDFFPKKEAEIFWKKDEIVFKTGLENINEERFTDAQGITHIVSTKKTLFKDKSGGKMIVGIIRDITDIKGTQADLQKSERFLSSIIDNVPNMIFVKDANELRFVKFNKAGEDLIGIPRTEMLGKNDYDFFPKKEADFFTSKDLGVLAGNKVLDIPEEPLTTKKGIRILHTKKIPLKDEKGNPLFLLGISEDITEKKKAEEDLKKAYDDLKKLNDFKNQLVINLSHELKTPVTPIMSESQMLEQGYLGNVTEEQKKAAGIILRNAKYLNTLIANIIDVTIIQSGVLKLNLETLYIEEMVGNLIEDLKPAAIEKKINLTAKTKDHFPSIIGDRARIKQVFSNLITNALKFTPENGRIIVGAEKSKEEIIFSVSDNGLGISKENIKNLFKPFFQVQPSYALKVKGSGLGLSICKGIVEQHGGRIWVESKIGKGTTFFFTLPLKQKEEKKKEEIKKEEVKKEVKEK